MKIKELLTTSFSLALAFCTAAIAQDVQPKQLVLITNARIFDRHNEKLADGMSVLVEGNKISIIAQSIPKEHS